MLDRRIALAALLAVGACSPDPAKVVGTWRSRTKQYLTVGKDLKGKVYQQTPCTPPLNVTVHRDPYDAYAIQFVPDQAVFFPPNLLSLFGGAQFFCSSSDSDPMCSFCRIEGKTMTCQAPEQKITGFGASVTHDCVWTQVSTSSTSTVTARIDAGVSCPPATVVDGGGCTAVIEAPPPVDSGSAAVDSGPDGGVRDGSAGAG